ncbi:MAG: UPF0262 family protein [Alphaproteobacteria bacterium]
MQESTERVVNITLDESTIARRTPDVEQERAVAIYDLLEANEFAPVGDYHGPYNLHLGIEEDRLAIGIRSEDDEPLDTVQLPLKPFRQLVKDYFLVCESYFSAIKTASPARIEAIDMGRRGLHDEGSELLRARLAGKIDIDFDTARRLFTLICVLHIRG